MRQRERIAWKLASVFRAFYRQTCEEGRRTGGVCEGLAALLAERAPGTRIEIEAGADTFIPLGDAWRPCLPSAGSIAARLDTPSAAGSSAGA